MAHQINKMAYVGQVPWHGLGTKLAANGTYEDVVKSAGFYRAEEMPLFMEGGKRVPDRKALVRGDTGAYLATVGDGYEMVQFEDVARTLVQAAGEVKAIFHTAGTLGARGAKGWLLGELPNPITVKGDDSQIRKYVVGVAGHDGVTAVSIKNVATRVVCANTLGSALTENGAEWRIQHAGSPNLRLEEAALAFRKLALGYDRLGELANVMAGTRFAEAQMLETIDEVIPLPEDDANHTRLEENRARVQRLFHEAVGLNDNIQNTAWAALQAWSEYSDHHRVQRATETQGAATARLESIWMGRGAQLKRRALASILSSAGIAMAPSASDVELVGA